MNSHFWIIVGAQVVLYLLFIIATRAKHHSFMELMLAGFIGIAFGSLFDIVFSYHKIYMHYPTGDGLPLYDTGLTTAELVINGYVSWGLMLASAKLLVDTLYKKEPKHFREGIPTLFFFLTVLAFGMFSTTVYTKGTIQYLFAAGAVLVSLGEVILYFAKKQSIVLETLFSYKHFITVFTLALAYGLICEITNNLFPFWRFMPTSTSSRATIEFLIVFVGYLGLFHPAMVLWKLISRGRTSR